MAARLAGLADRLQWLGRWLRRAALRPLWISALYVAAIFAFAGAYAWYWREFYQSTSGADLARPAMEDQLRAVLKPAPTNWLATIQCNEKIYWRLSNIAVEPSDDVASPALFAQYLSVGQRGRWSRSTEYRLTWRFLFDRDLIRARNRGEYFELDPRHRDDWVLVQVTGIPVTLPENCAHRIAHDAVSAFENEPLRPWVMKSAFRGDLVRQATYSEASFVGVWNAGSTVIARIREYYVICRGTPAPASFGFGRYLYLSVVTITTLGFGDMVPVTDRARGLVAIEAIVGVILAGLFLNALAVKIAERRPPRD